ncbi:MAG TPA: tagaturonate reductase [Chitinophagaceae bacterium]|nr:tagaturonate reductase [Chitinophagaceae bacterium]
MKISKQTIGQITPRVALEIPKPASFDLPERIIQFGTGVLLRGLPDYFVDKANKQGLFNGRIVMVKSTDQGDIKVFEGQDGIYTLCVRGMEGEQKVEQFLLVNAVSRVLSAREDWGEVIKCAFNEDLQIVISNTTEVGIQLSDDDITSIPPASFPGKLLAFLYARYLAFDGDQTKGMVIIPTELLTDNGDKLKGILLELAKFNQLSESFVGWLNTANTFCNSLVDRIVPGSLPERERTALENALGYEDDLLISAESYRLWAIETPDQKVNEILSFSPADKGVVLADDITKHRELKLRLLNGTHTFSCALAYLSGFDTVGQAMDDQGTSGFIQRLMMDEIAPAIASDTLSLEEARSFAAKILDRFRNPYIIHRWLSIATQYSSKMKMRNIPILLAHYQKSTQPPEAMSAGLAAYILFMCSTKETDGTYKGTYGEKGYTIKDDSAGILFDWWGKFPDNPVSAILSDTRLWDTDLTLLPGLVGAVEAKMQEWMKRYRMASS